MYRKIIVIFNVLITSIVLTIIGNDANVRAAAAETPYRESYPDYIKMVAIGDSYTAGNAAGSDGYFGVKECFKNKNNWSRLIFDHIYNNKYTDKTYINAACSGSELQAIYDYIDLKNKPHYITYYNKSISKQNIIKNIHSFNKCKNSNLYEIENRGPINISIYDDLYMNRYKVEYDCDYKRKPQIDFIDSDTTDVVFSIGGNDINFSSVVKACLLYDWKKEECDKILFNANKLLDNPIYLENDIYNLLIAIYKRMIPTNLNFIGRKNVVIVGYPYLSVNDHQWAMRDLPDDSNDIFFIKQIPYNFDFHNFNNQFQMQKNAVNRLVDKGNEVLARAVEKFKEEFLRKRSIEFKLKNPDSKSFFNLNVDFINPTYDFMGYEPKDGLIPRNKYAAIKDKLDMFASQYEYYHPTKIGHKIYANTIWTQMRMCSEAYVRTFYVKGDSYIYDNNYIYEKCFGGGYNYTKFIDFDRCYSKNVFNSPEYDISFDSKTNSDKKITINNQPRILSARNVVSKIYNEVKTVFDDIKTIISGVIIRMPKLRLFSISNKLGIFGFASIPINDITQSINIPETTDDLIGDIRTKLNANHWQYNTQKGIISVITSESDPVSEKDMRSLVSLARANDIILSFVNIGVTNPTYKVLADSTFGFYKDTDIDHFKEDFEIVTREMATRPVAHFEVNINNKPGDVIKFDASTSRSGKQDGYLKYEWDFESDGIIDITTEQPIVEQAVNKEVMNYMTLIVTDSDGAKDSYRFEFTVSKDYDRIPDNIDNCPNVPNLSQSDWDYDGIGDACDPETDFTKEYTKPAGYDDRYSIVYDAEDYVDSYDYGKIDIPAKVEEAKKSAVVKAETKQTVSINNNENKANDSQQNNVDNDKNIEKTEDKNQQSTKTNLEKTVEARQSKLKYYIAGVICILILTGVVIFLKFR